MPIRGFEVTANPRSRTVTLALPLSAQAPGHGKRVHYAQDLTAESEGDVTLPRFAERLWIDIAPAVVPQMTGMGTSITVGGDRGNERRRARLWGGDN